MKKLATISDVRTFNLTADHRIELLWDNQRFTLGYDQFVGLARTLEAARHSFYVRHCGCTCVRVDDTEHELWLGKTCITLSGDDYRALRDAALQTETRLHGLLRSLPTEPAPVPNLRMVGVWRAPREIAHCQN